MSGLPDLCDLLLQYTRKLCDKVETPNLDCQIIKADLNEYCGFLGDMKSYVPLNIFADYEEFFTHFIDFAKLCNDTVFLNTNGNNITSSLDLIIECIEDIKKRCIESVVKCPCCGKSVVYSPLDSYYSEMEKRYGCEKFIDETLNEEKYLCPACASSDRDRLIVSFLKKEGLETAKEGTRLLHIAPSQPIQNWILLNCPQVNCETSDLFMDGVDYQSDIQDMKEIEDNAFDIVICSHVLEHVQDDMKAFASLKRILKEDGKLIFLVPVDLGREEIDEEWGCSEAENWKRFGQGDHCRRYSKSGLYERMSSHFYVNSLGKEYFGKSIFDNCGLSDTSTLYVLTKEADVSLSFANEVLVNKELCKNGPLVSVVLPCYNHERFVAEAIESVINQSYKNIEFIIGDDASTDGTVEVIRKYSQFYSKEVYNTENTGILDETLCEYASGKYIALMHSDDIWDLDKLAIQVDYMENNPECGACFTWCDYVDLDLNPLLDYTFIKRNRTREEWMEYFWTRGNALCNPSSLVRNKLAFKHGQFGFENRQLPDLFKWVNFVENHEIHIITKRLTFMRRYKMEGLENTSYATAETIARTNVECGITWLPVIRDMDDEFFVKCFRKYLINKDVTDSIEIKCEKLLLFLASKNIFIQYSGLYYYEEIYDEVKDVLKEKYGYKGNMFRNDELEKGLGKYIKLIL